MNLLLEHMNTRIFCDRIQCSSYEQGLTTHCSRVFPTVIDLLFSNYDNHYDMVESRDKNLYVKQRLVAIATDIDEMKDSKYDNFSYLKCMNPTLIQQGLQSANAVSALLYLGDLYDTTMNVYIESSMLKVVTCVKDRKAYNILYTADGKWKDMNEADDGFQEGQLTDLGQCLTLDVNTRDIYKKYLLPMGKYKVKELADVANSMNISLEVDGKKKIKKQLYDDINTYQLNLS